MTVELPALRPAGPNAHEQLSYAAATFIVSAQGFVSIRVIGASCEHVPEWRDHVAAPESNRNGGEGLRR